MKNSHLSKYNLTAFALTALTFIPFMASSGWATIIEGNLEVKAGTGASSSNGDLTIDGTTSLKGNTSLGDATDDITIIKGPITANNTFTVGGTTTLKGDTTLGDSVDDITTIKGPVTAESNLSIGGSLKVGTVENASVPAGVIVMWSGAIDAIPAGWALCNGETPQGESNPTPNLSGRFIVGYDVSNEDYDDISSFNNRTGGSDDRALTISNMPSHTHKIRGSDTNDDNNGGWVPQNNGGAYTSTNGTKYNQPRPKVELKGSESDLSTDRPSKDVYITETSGSGDTFDNRPAYYVLAYIIKL